MADQQIGNVHGFAATHRGVVAAADKETATITIDATGGTWDLDIYDTTVSGIAWDVTASALQTSIRAVAPAAEQDVAVTGGPGGTAALVITFQGPGDYENVTTDPTSLTGGAGTADVVISEGTLRPENFDVTPNLSGGTSAQTGFFDADLLDIDAMRTRLAAIDGTYYTAARLNQMSYNDMMYAIRLADNPETIKQ